MRKEELIEQCLQALASGQELPPDLARYLARHPDQRAEVEDLLAIAQSVTQLPPAELSKPSRTRMQERLAQRLNFDPAMLDAPVAAVAQEQDMEQEGDVVRKKRPFSVGRLSVARLRYAPPPSEDPSEARIRAVFRDLTPDDIRRYIGVRGEDYLYFRQGLPGWEPVFAFLAFVLRSFKRLEKLMEPGP
ncbi:MAG: hypothetical protein ABIO92_02460 [Chloroflexia bacterium]